MREMLILYRRSKIGFDLNSVGLSWIEWEIIATVSEWFEMKAVERENAILGIKQTHGI